VEKSIGIPGSERREYAPRVRQPGEEFPYPIPFPRPCDSPWRARSSISGRP